MPAVIDSSPECVNQTEGYVEDFEGDVDEVDFILQADYADCAGIMTFGPGTVYGESGAETSYYILTWIGIAFMVVALIAWIVFENRHLLAYAAGRVRGGRGG
jgi:hypothetical protein